MINGELYKLEENSEKLKQEQSKGRKYSQLSPSEDDRRREELIKIPKNSENQTPLPGQKK